MNDKQSARSSAERDPAGQRLNGPAPHEPPLPTPQKLHVFSDRERAFFFRQIQQMNALQGAIQNAIALVIEQQALEGQWRLRPDGSALERIDTPAT